MKHNFLLSIKESCIKYKHVLYILYLPLYMHCFICLEERSDVHFTDIHCALDDRIPFCEIFIIPYLSWFLYVVLVLFFLFFQTEHLEDFYACIHTLIFGMSTCLLIYYLFPNMQNMRPVLERDNIFTDIIGFIYKSDTDTNVLPSIHVYNAVAIHIGFSTSHYFRERRGWKTASLILCILICLSTMFLKQHSFLDVITGIILFGIYGGLFYIIVPKLRKKGKEPGTGSKSDTL